jgi:predicted DsbA family dithiol-disulfide isomerase
LEKLESSHPVEVTWRAFELRPKGSPPMPAEYRAKIEASRPRLYAVAQEQYGLTMNPGPFGRDTRPALAAAKVAEAAGVGKAFHAAVMRAYWQEARDIEAVETLADLAEAAGMEKAAFLAALAEPQFDDAVQSDVEMAVQAGLTSVPAIVFDMRYLVPGAQPYATLVEITEKVLAELAGDEAAGE